MRKMDKRYYVFIFILAFVLGIVIRGIEKNSFSIVRNSTVFAPEFELLVNTDNDENAKININEAETYELVRLYGIGDSLAERIIDYRTKNGNFEVIEDIMKVSGIGEKTFNGIREHIYVE